MKKQLAMKKKGSNFALNLLNQESLEPVSSFDEEVQKSGLSKAKSYMNVLSCHQRQISYGTIYEEEECISKHFE